MAPKEKQRLYYREEKQKKLTQVFFDALSFYCSWTIAFIISQYLLMPEFQPDSPCILHKRRLNMINNPDKINSSVGYFNWTICCCLIPIIQCNLFYRTIRVNFPHCPILVCNFRDYKFSFWIAKFP